MGLLALIDGLIVILVLVKRHPVIFATIIVIAVVTQLIAFRKK